MAELKTVPAGINDEICICAVDIGAIVKEGNKVKLETGSHKVIENVATELEEGMTITAHPGGNPNKVINDFTK